MRSRHILAVSRIIHIAVQGWWEKLQKGRGCKVGGKQRGLALLKQPGSQFLSANWQQLVILYTNFLILLHINTIYQFNFISNHFTFFLSEIHSSSVDCCLLLFCLIEFVSLLVEFVWFSVTFIYQIKQSLVIGCSNAQLHTCFIIQRSNTTAQLGPSFKLTKLCNTANEPKLFK